MIIKQASDLHFTYVRNTPELRDAFIDKCNEFGIEVFNWEDSEPYLEVYGDDDCAFEIVGTFHLEPQSKRLTMSDLTGIPTQTPEEKEVLDLIDTTPHQYEMSKFSGEAEWKNGDDVEAYGKSYKYVGLDPFNDNLCICLANQDDDPQCFSFDEIKKPESPQQREERERLEAAYDLYCHIAKMSNRSPYSFDQFSSDSTTCYRKEYLEIVCKTNYRKEKTHGTN